jgi:hypothetical protein
MANSGRSEVERTLAPHLDWLLSLPGIYAVWPKEDHYIVDGRDVSPETKRQIQERIAIPVKYEEKGPYTAQGG